VTTISVLFSCPRCGLIYRAAQRLRDRGENGPGKRFDCPACKAEVHYWSGAYDYAVWTPLDAEPLTGRNS